MKAYAVCLTVPGLDVTTAVTHVAMIGDVRRFPSSRQLVGYLGLHPRVRQSGNGPAHGGGAARALIASGTGH